MNGNHVPGFVAEVTLYMTRNRYRSFPADPYDAIASRSVVPALTDNENCERCINKCNEQSAECVGYATATWSLGLAGCAFWGPFSPACAAPVTVAYLVANGICYGKLAACHAVCNAPGESCCPVFCGPGHCCSEGETCMLDGCCPRDRQVCGGECCAQGAGCCADTCCGPGDHCCGSACCPANVPCGPDGSCAGFANTPPPPPPPSSCPPGSSPCGVPDGSGVIRTCCPPGTVCCGVSSDGQPDCVPGVGINVCLH